MRRALALLLAFFAWPVPAAAADAGAERIVVGRAPGLSPAERADVRADAGVELLDALSVADAEVVRPADGDVDAALRALRSDPDVRWAQRDHVRHLAALPTTDTLLP